MEEIRDNIYTIRKSISDICERCNYSKDNITLIAVTKTVDTNRINYAIENGITDIGENKVQEVVEKYEHIKGKVNWHLIGHLQSNKVKYIIDKVDLIHSVDSMSLVQEINKKAAKNDLIKDILVQINIAEEESKFGIGLDDAVPMIKEISTYGNIRVKGLMTIAPLFDDLEKTRPIFRALKSKHDEIKSMNINNVEMKYLSMGMTGDYHIAIEEGSNLIRVGTGIFGKRNYNINQEV